MKLVLNCLYVTRVALMRYDNMSKEEAVERVNSVPYHLLDRMRRAGLSLQQARFQIFAYGYDGGEDEEEAAV